MNTITAHPRRQLTTIDRAILALHGIAALGVGVAGFVGADDPGWRALQRLAVLMLVAAWGAGIAAMGFAIRFIPWQWVRAVVLVGGPFIGILFLYGFARLG